MEPPALGPGSPGGSQHELRLATATGIHAKHWTRQQVLDCVDANSPAELTRAISEAERFVAIPDQALACKTGQLEIRELRIRAE